MRIRKNAKGSAKGEGLHSHLPSGPSCIVGRCDRQTQSLAHCNQKYIQSQQPKVRKYTHRRQGTKQQIAQYHRHRQTLNRQQQPQIAPDLTARSSIFQIERSTPFIPSLDRPLQIAHQKAQSSRIASQSHIASKKNPSRPQSLPMPPKPRAYTRNTDRSPSPVRAHPGQSPSARTDKPKSLTMSISPVVWAMRGMYRRSQP
jgi:hypothetical protein